MLEVVPDDSPTYDTRAVKREPEIKASAVAMLHQACLRVFGKLDAIQFEFIEDEPQAKQCIITITRPNNSTRSYKSEAIHSRKVDAKLQAATIAVDMGALDFIASGDPDLLKAKKGTLLARPDVADSMDTDTTATEGWSMSMFEDDESAKAIEQCCAEWRPGRVWPEWVPFGGLKGENKFGCALRVSLSPHAFRVCSVDSTYPSHREAKTACAKLAIDQGFLDFIKYGNGQTQQPTRTEAVQIPDAGPATTPLTLQEFYETLPQPFPEAVGDKTAAEINAPAWLNTTLQSARGGQLTCNFISTDNLVLGHHGCLLRLDRPNESRTYLVDCRFPKRADAKAAVCLLAMSQGVGNYIRKVKEDADNKLPAKMRLLANERILPLLSIECGKIRPGNRPEYEFITERHAYGCILKLDLSTESTVANIRKYDVPAEYRTKADAKAAVACLAAKQGAIDILRYRGKSPTP
ncbi:hypothetical protein BDQ12DRAFT_612281, partial [Crucibulum laeve]